MTKDLQSSLSVPLSKVLEVTENSLSSKAMIEMHIRESGPMRESELLSKIIRPLKSMDLSEMGISTVGIEPELIP